MAEIRRKLGWTPQGHPNTPLELIDTLGLKEKLKNKTSCARRDLQTMSNDTMVVVDY